MKGGGEGGGRASLAAGESQKAMKASRRSAPGPRPSAPRASAAGGSPPRGEIVASTPRLSSSSTAARDWSAIPRPARAACLIAPFEPSVSTRGRMPLGEVLLAQGAARARLAQQPGPRR